MGHQTLIQTTPEQWGHSVPQLALVTTRHRNALAELHDAYADGRPLAILTGQGKYEANHVISGFLSSLDDDITVVRLTKPYDDAIGGMREINRALGFEPKDLKLAELDKILTMYLEFQRKHHRRTLLCIEQSHRQGRWLLDQVRRLVELELSGKYGLFTILSGRSDMTQALSESPLEDIRSQAGNTITLAPFSLAETTEFLRQRVSATGDVDVSQLFEFDAINRLHEVSEGVPDTLGLLCFKCLQLAHKRKTGAVNARLVTEAEKLLQTEALEETSIAKVDFTSAKAIEPSATAVVSDRVPVAKAPQESDRPLLQEKLLARRNGVVVNEFPIVEGRFMVGRATPCDICLPSEFVSKRHALFIRTPNNLQVLDLGSTNGTYVNDRRIQRDQVLKPGDVATIGDCRIEYFLD